MKKNKGYQISRGDFLKLSSIGLLSAASIPLSIPNFLIDSFPFDLAQNSMRNPESNLKTYGRVLDKLVYAHNKPSILSPQTRAFRQDSILTIKNTVLDADNPSKNNRWFEIKPNVYVHRSKLQPVEIDFNSVATEIGIWGALAEVSVPYTNAYLYANYNQSFTYRYYYKTTHWVKRTVYDNQDRAWYEIKDDLNVGKNTYVPAKHMRILPGEEFSLLSPDVPAEEKRIEVLLDQQIVIAYEYDKVVFSATVSTGDVEKNIFYKTPTGNFNTFYKRPSQHLSAENLLFGGYDLPGVPWLSYISNYGIAFHGAYWHNDFGQPRSHGCINLRPDDAKWIYRWTTPFVSPEKQLLYNKDPNIGTRVDVI